MDKLVELESFARVVAAGSFTAAAASLGLTTSAVSKHVRALEERLGARLLSRTTRRVAPTEAGRAFGERVQLLLQEIAEAEEAVAQLQSEPRGTLRVGAPMDFGRAHLAEPLARFAAAHPGIALEVEFADRFVDLIEEGFDVAVRIGTLTDSSLVARRLAGCRRLVCASPAYLEAFGAPSTVSGLQSHRRIGYAYESDRSFRFEAPDGREERVVVPVRHHTNNGEMTRRLVLAGEGIALLPTFLIADDLRAGRLRALLPGHRVPDLAIHALYPHRKHLSAKVRAFVDFLAAHCGPEPYWDAGLPIAGERAVC